MKTTIQPVDALFLKSGICAECLTKHSPDTPHDKDSLFYQCTFYTKYGRWPTWADAVAHCFSSKPNESYYSYTKNI